ncbi:MAG: hypothetical protein JWM99_4171 [Verrucomicrobiales bacterium]|nr:hypothetical protein [Verrucomicrobiales bacterium]
MGRSLGFVRFGWGFCPESTSKKSLNYFEGSPTDVPPPLLR